MTHYKPSRDISQVNSYNEVALSRKVILSYQRLIVATHLAASGRVYCRAGAEDGREGEIAQRGVMRLSYPDP